MTPNMKHCSRVTNGRIHGELKLEKCAMANNICHVEFKNFTKIIKNGTSKNFTFLNCKKRPAHLIKKEGRRRPRISDDGSGTCSKFDFWVFEIS